jgi:hypothetical protein
MRNESCMASFPTDDAFRVLTDELPVFLTQWFHACEEVECRVSGLGVCARARYLGDFVPFRSVSGEMFACTASVFQVFLCVFFKTVVRDCFNKQGSFLSDVCSGSGREDLLEFFPFRGEFGMLCVADGLSDVVPCDL